MHMSDKSEVEKEKFEVFADLSYGKSKSYHIRYEDGDIKKLQNKESMTFAEIVEDAKMQIEIDTLIYDALVS